MWVTALAVAINFSFGADIIEIVDLSSTISLYTRFSVLGAVIGGLLFGYGMARAGNYGYGVLSQLSGGDIRAFIIVHVMGIIASTTMFGILSGIRDGLFSFEPSPNLTQGIVHWIAGGSGLLANAIGLTIGVLALLASIRFQTSGQRLRRLDWGTLVGIAINSGFIGKYYVATHGFEPWPVGSHTFTEPVGETIHYAMFSKGLVPKFRTGSVLGVIIGSAIGSLNQDGFRWEACDDPRELRRQLACAPTMGFGAVLAAGCSVGQSLSGPLVVLRHGAFGGDQHLDRHVVGAQTSDLRP